MQSPAPAASPILLPSSNDLLAAATSAEIENLPAPSIADPYRLNYVTAMVEVCGAPAGGMPPLWTADVAPLDRPVFIDPSLSLRAHLLTASPPPGGHYWPRIGYGCGTTAAGFAARRLPAVFRDSRPTEARTM